MATGTRSCDPAVVRELQNALKAGVAHLDPSRGPILLSFDLPPEFEPLRVWRAFPGLEATFWQSPDGLRSASAGRVEFVTAMAGASPGRPEEALTRLADRLLHLDLLSGEACPEPIRLFGGTAFAAGAAQGAWQAFGKGGFVLPRLTVEGTGQRIRGRLVLDGSEAAENQALARTWVEALCTQADGERVPAEPLAPRASTLPAAETKREASGGDPVPDDWVRLVEAARAQIRSRKLRKVVVCRQQAVSLPGGCDPVSLLSRLASRNQEYVFGFRRGDRTFLGASPELLMEKKGDRLRTEALAGTRQLDPDLDRTAALAAAAEELYGSGKDLEEHAIVVRGIVESLDSIASERMLPAWPEVRGLTGLAHLCSAIEADLRTGLGPLETLAALHPTPAVGGLPREAALLFLSETEPVERGWYAGPVGWITPDGDAQIAVGIRSALVGPDRAWLYAGAGIVLASNPEDEFRETEAKLRRLSSALGVTEIPG